MKYLRTNSKNKDFIQLVHVLNEYLAEINGEDHSFYMQFNGIDQLNVIVAYKNDEAVGCGAMKEYNKSCIEIKRMFVPLAHRGKGVASFILNELERWALELSYKTCILETSRYMPAAISLYEKNGYNPTENYGQYNGNEDSQCFKKELSSLAKI